MYECAFCELIWETEYPNIQSVEIVFPVRGHSFIPPDRVFGLIEKDIKNKKSTLR